MATTGIIKHPSELADVNAPAGSRITVATTGAVFLVSPWLNPDYNEGQPDGVCIVAMPGDRYGILQDVAGVYDLRHVQSNESDDRRLQRSINYAAANDARIVRVIGNITLEDTVTIKKGVCVESNFFGGGWKWRREFGGTVHADLNDAEKPAFKVEDAGGGYMEGVRLKNIDILATSPALCGLELNKPYMANIECVNVDGGINNRYFKHGVIIQAGIMSHLDRVQVENIGENGLYFPRGQWGTTTMSANKCYIRECDIGVKIERGRAASITMTSCTIEHIDNSVLVSKSLKQVKIIDLHTEEIAGEILFDIGRYTLDGDEEGDGDGGTFMISNSRLHGSGLQGAIGIMSNHADYISIRDCLFTRLSQVLTCKRNTNRVRCDNVIEKAVTASLANGAGLSRPEVAALTMVGSEYENNSVFPKLKAGI